MKKYTMIILAATVIGAGGTVHAQTTSADVNAEVEGIHKADEAIAKQNHNLEVNRKEKAAAKAKGNVADQASQSVQIGTNKAARSVHRAEREYHENRLQDKVDSIKQDE